MKRASQKLYRQLSSSLGPSAEEILAEDRNTNQEQSQRFAEAEKELQQAETLTAEREKESQEIHDLERQIERTQPKIDAIQDERGSNLQSVAELRRLQQLKKKSSNRD